jgi:uncharacterized protein (TIGR00251 family)
MRLSLKVVPKSSRNAVDGWMDDSLKVCVIAQPERGKANAAVIETLTQALGIPRDAVRIVAGEKSRRKIVDLDGLDEAEVRRRLASASKRGDRLHRRQT